MAQTIYAKMTKDLDGVVLELIDYGYHIMGVTFEDASKKAEQYLKTQTLTKQPTKLQNIDVTTHEIIAFQV
ncbi:MAG: hypothetical protein ACRCZC_02185 [Culicoidibacterales bacterium]